jgi:hypothetical protein
MCDYWHGGTFECRGDGYMWDADCDGYDPEDHSFPCPACNTHEYLLSAQESGESISYSSGWGGCWTGEDMWLGGVNVAMHANPHVAPRLLRQIGIVRPIIDHPTDRAGFVEKFYDHRNERRLVSRRQREGYYAGRYFGSAAHFRSRDKEFSLAARSGAFPQEASNGDAA